MLDALLRNIFQPHHFTFKIRKPVLSNHIEICAQDPENCHAFLKTPDNSLYIRQLSFKPPLAREEWAEEPVSTSIQEIAAGYYLSASPYPLIPSLVCAFKYILLSHYPLPGNTGNAHWAFVGLEATKWKGSAFSPLSIENIFCKNGLGRCECRAEDGFYGILYFAWADFGIKQ